MQTTTKAQNKNETLPDEEALCYGTATIGERGQLVIPRDARKALGLKPGEKLIIFGNHNKMLALVKTDQVSRIVQDFNSALGNLHDILEEE
jgi:AbrB family looped-hinge helix DNA binding protein